MTHQGGRKEGCVTKHYINKISKHDLTVTFGPESRQIDFHQQ